MSTILPATPLTIPECRQLLIWPNAATSELITITPEQPQLMLLELQNGQCVMLLLAMGELMRDVCHQYDMAIPNWLDCRCIHVPLARLAAMLNRESRPLTAATLADWNQYFLAEARWPIYCFTVERFDSQLPRKISHFQRCKRLFQPEYLRQFSQNLLFAELITSWPKTIPLSFERYNALIHGDAITQRNRTDALRVFPLSAKLWGVEDDREAVLRRVIDLGEALIPALTLHAQVSTEVARWVLSIQPDDLPPCLILRPIAEILQLCARIPREKRPSNPAEWRIFGMVMQAWLGDMPWQSLALSWLPTLAKQGWQNSLDKARQCYAAENPFEAIEDFLQHLARYIRNINPVYELQEYQDRQTEFERQLAQALMGLSPWQILLAGRYWLRQLHQAPQEATKSISDSYIWPSPLTAPWHHQLGYVLALRSESELFLEGCAMHHCVASRAIDCIESPMFIFSVRSPDDERLSTVQLQLCCRQEQGFYWRVYEHRALQNGVPSTQAQILVRDLIVELCHLNDEVLNSLYRRKTIAPKDAGPTRNFTFIAMERTVMAHGYLQSRMVAFLPYEIVI